MSSQRNEPFGTDEDACTEERSDQDQPCGLCVITSLKGIVDGERQRLRFARDISRQHERSAEFAHASRKGQESARQYAAKGKWQRYTEEDAEFRSTQRASGVFKAGVNGFKGSLADL